nr:VC2046/SO_2500 family protein [Colwellia sp. E2M01]
MQKSSAAEVNAGNIMPSAETTSANTLLHELQLGGQLNKSVAETRRADFSLMLAMLVDDVREQSQFLLPKTAATKEIKQTESALRKQFNLPDKAPLALSSLDDIKQFNQAQILVDNDLANIQLANVMNPKPLAFRDDKKHIATEVMNNTSLFTQIKYKQAQQQALALSTQQSEHESSVNMDMPVNQSLAFNANTWLDGIQQSLVKAPLLN